MEQFPQFKPKSKEELRKQLAEAEKTAGEKLIPEEEQETALVASSSTLKGNYSEKYKKYISALRSIHESKKKNEQSIEYSPEELTNIQKALSGEPNTVSEKLWEKVKNDINVDRYNVSIFFPVIRERILNNKETPIVTALPAQARKNVMKVEFQDTSYLIKPIKGFDESRIAHTAADLEIGPKQFESLSNNLTEEFIEGSTLSRLDSQKCTAENMECWGRQIGLGIKKLHEKNILINEQLLRNNSSDSHTIVTPESSVRFIDFGRSVDVSKFPELSNEDTYTLLQTDPFGTMHIGDKSGEDLVNELHEYLSFLKQKYASKEDLIQDRDNLLTEEGLISLGQILPNVDSLRTGIMSVLEK